MEIRYFLYINIADCNPPFKSVQYMFDVEGICHIKTDINHGIRPPDTIVIFQHKRNGGRDKSKQIFTDTTKSKSNYLNSPMRACRDKITRDRCTELYH